MIGYMVEDKDIRASKATVSTAIDQRIILMLWMFEGVDVIVNVGCIRNTVGATSIDSTVHKIG